VIGERGKSAGYNLQGTSFCESSKIHWGSLNIRFTQFSGVKFEAGRVQQAKVKMSVTYSRGHSDVTLCHMVVRITCSGRPESNLSPKNWCSMSIEIT
jgi:hypothetical protein